MAEPAPGVERRRGSSGPGASSRAAWTRPCAPSPPWGDALHRRLAARAPTCWDVEGTGYLDMVQSYGAVLLGHAHPAVTAAVAAAAARGTTFGAPTPGEVLLAEAICERVPGCEQVRLVSSGTEAAMSAVRLARGATGRDRVVKFDGCYHGHSDGLLAGGGSGVATLGLPGSAGVSAACRGRHPGRSLQRRPRARRAGGLRDRRAGGGEHEPGGARAGIPRGAPRRVPCQRRPPHLRRGHHRLPARPGGRHGRGPA